MSLNLETRRSDDGLVGGLRASWTAAMEGEVKAFGFEAFRQRPIGPGRQIDIENILTGITIKMAMFAHVRAKTGRAAFERNLANDAALHQRVQAIIDCSHGNIGHGPLGAHKNGLGRGMIPLCEQNLVHLLALRRKTEATSGQPLVQRMV